MDVRREAERGCGDVKKRCGAVAPQELPLIVGGGRRIYVPFIPVRARAAEEERCELPDDIFGEWMPLLICEKRHV